MKNLLISSILIAFIPVQKTRAQITYHFLHTGAVWGQFQGNIAFINWEWVLIGGTNFQDSEGDTIIDNQTYIKIGSCDSAGNQSGFLFGFIREDSTGKVWRYDEVMDSDILLYDFNLVAGDTAFIIPPSGENYCYMVVDSIGAVDVLGNARKAIYFDPDAGPCAGALWGGDSLSEPVMWIEGIGSNGGLFYPNGGSIVPDASEWLTCYRENGQIAFGDVCNIVLGANLPATITSSVKVSPNPFSASVEIKISSISQNSQIKLFDQSGREMNINSHIFFEGNQGKIIIERNNLPSGIYFLSASAGEKHLMIKLVAE